MYFLHFPATIHHSSITELFHNVQRNRRWNADAGTRSRRSLRKFHPGPSDSDGIWILPLTTTRVCRIRRDISLERLQAIRDIHQGGFVTAFASVSPEEDFVETYKILSLSHAIPAAPLQISLVVSNPAGVELGRIPILPSADTSTSDKRTCVDTLFQ